MAEGTRIGFHKDLEEIDQKVLQLFAMVAEGVAKATDAFLANDRDAAESLIETDAVIDQLYCDVEELVQRQFATQSPMARDMRFLLSVLRIVPELERSGDLAEHIANRATRGVSDNVTPRIRGLIEQMGHVATQMWREAADAYIDRDGDAAGRLAERDDELDELHSSLTAELVTGQLRVPIALEMALIARFYERLGDHAVNIGERIRYIAEGL
ncbi:MAG: phosphate signaling complex protein PhoU [Acidimicrobiia bacterium]|nr:phosphate signaling complex protein PhoU [Acidimicrobiia bacterium]MBV8986747.1 phosphate signaling complex protein PhoU [Acidimicrobiia bacterium]